MMSERNARARRSGPATIGPSEWDMNRATYGTDALVMLLLAGWEPFAVVGELVYLKRRVVEQ